MKIKDILGRTLDIEVVVKGPQGWMTPVGYKIDDLPTRFVRVPHGHFALRVMAQESADVMVHLNGELLTTQSVAGKSINYIEQASDGKPFLFSAKSEGEEDVCDVMPSAKEAEQATPKPPRGHGLLFVVARFTHEQTPYTQPPQQEYTFPFQLNAGKEHDTRAASNLRQMVQPEPAPNADDLTSREPATKGIVRHCATCGRDH